MLFVPLMPFLLAACGNQPSGTATSSSPAVPSTAASRPAGSSSSALVDVFATDLSTGRAVPLTATQAISGIVDVKKQGSVLAFAVQVGNYDNTADGNLAVKLCEGTTCSGGAAPIANSSDNKYLEIPLGHAIVVVSGERLHYTLTRAAGSKSFAIWTYADATAKTTMPDGSSEPRVPRIGLRYGK
jgi:hypothetical protein